jgi:hypothetical protein
MLHIKGNPNTIISKKRYQLFSPNSEVQAIANLQEGSYLFYYKHKQPSLKNYFSNYKVIGSQSWDPAGTINGHNLIESNRGKNMYLIGDFNIVGLEESYITGIYAANKIIGIN